MSDPGTLRLLIETAERERDDAARRVAQARGDAQAAGATRASLEGYRIDLHDRAPTVRGTSFEPALLTHFAAFDRRLDAAIVEQGRHATRFERIAEAAQRELIERQQRLHSLQTLVARRLELAATAERRRDQKTTDETAARLRAGAFTGLGRRQR